MPLPRPSIENLQAASCSYFLFLISNILPQLEPSTILPSSLPPDTRPTATSPSPASPQPKSRSTTNQKKKDYKLPLARRLASRKGLQPFNPQQLPVDKSTFMLHYKFCSYFLYCYKFVNFD